MFKYDTYSPIVFLSKPTGHNNLDPYRKSCRHYSEKVIEESGKHRCPQCYHPQMSQEGCIGKIDDRLGQSSQHNGQRNAPNLPIADFCFHLKPMNYFLERQK
jgi:hypothetical protein